MKPHVHIGAETVIAFALTLIIVGFIFRTIEIKYPDTVLGKALVFIY